jgi:hypothetical protein
MATMRRVIPKVGKIRIKIIPRVVKLTNQRAVRQTTIIKIITVMAKIQLVMT